MDQKIFGGRYAVLEKIGAGGMAIVYKAKDQLLNRVVTIKVLREQFVTDQDFIRRFRREAQSAASLSHPNIVSIYDVGKDGDTEYIVMEYVEGRNLKEIIREYAPLSVEQSINLGRQIAEAIQNAHEHHIIHRDIKPHNILVTADGHAKVTDFGIALAVSSATVTHAEEIVGSVHYLSPEQAKGLPSNEQSDIYSLGIVLYELVTGKVPYDGETPITIALKHLQEDPVPPSKTNPRVDKDYETIVMRAIAKSSAQRYASAKDLLADFNNLQAGRSIAQAPSVVDDELDDLEATQFHQGMGKVLSPVSAKGGAVEEGPSGLINKLRSLSKRQKLMAGGVAALCLILLIVGGWKFYRYVNAGTVKVPNVVGKTLQEAKDLLQREQLVVDEGEVRYDFSDTVGEGLIIKQDPGADEMVRPNRPVALTVSQGTEKLPFPDVISMSLEKAKSTILEHGFDENRIEVSSKFHTTIAKGHVIDQNPTKGASWTKTGEITLTVSEGPPQSKRMPNVIGKTTDEAKKILEDENLTVKIETQSSESMEAGMVVSTKPNPGDALQGTEVTIIVSLGPGPLAREMTENVYLARNIENGRNGQE